MISVLEFFEDISPIIYILLTLLALVSLLFFLLLLWRLWCISGMFLKMFNDWRFRGTNIRETMVQIQRFCRKYADREE